jgi:hypothetical protein
MKKNNLLIQQLLEIGKRKRKKRKKFKMKINILTNLLEEVIKFRLII